MIRSYSSSVMSASGAAAADAGDVEHGVDAPNVASAAANIASTVGLVGDVAPWNGTTASPSAAAVSSCRPLMSAASTLAPSRTNTSRRRPRHPRTRAGDDRDLPVELTHA